MRNLTTTAIILEHPTGHRTFVEPCRQPLEAPDLYDEQDTAVRLGTKQRPIPVRKRKCAPGERERINAELRRHVNDDREETGDGIVLVEHELLPLVDHDLRDCVFTPEPVTSRLRNSPLVRRLIAAGDPP